MLETTYDFVLRLPAFRGKAKVEAHLRRRLRPKPCRIIGGLAMELDPEEWTQIELRSVGHLEPATTGLFDRLLAPGDTFIDVGAHVGYHALCARRRVGERGRILAVDPQPYNCHKILTNAELNGFANITVVAAAAGTSPAFVSLQHQSRNDKARLTLRGAGINDRTATFVAPVITLDWLFETYLIEHAALLKIDV